MKTKLKPFKVRYDRQVKMWVAIDPSTDIASQGDTKNRAINNLIEALRLACLTYQDIESAKSGIRAKSES